MPDADDFDVEYFRNLLKGTAAKKEQPAPAAAKGARPPGKAAAVKATSTSKVARRKGKKS